VGYLSDPPARATTTTEGGSFMRWLATPGHGPTFALGEGVSRTAMAALLSGRSPVDGSLIRRYGPAARWSAAFDVTLSPAPKSVSILWALGDDELRAELEVVVLLSVNGAIAGCWTRVRSSGAVRSRPARRAARPRAGLGRRPALHTTAQLSKGRDIPTRSSTSTTF